MSAQWRGPRYPIPTRHPSDPWQDPECVVFGDSENALRIMPPLAARCRHGNRVGMSPLLRPKPTHRPEKENPAIKRRGVVMGSGVCVSVSALRATTTPAHPAISLVRHRVRFAATSAALRSNAPAALKRLQRSGSARSAAALSFIRGKTPPSAFGLRPVFPLCLPSAAIHPFLSPLQISLCPVFPFLPIRYVDRHQTFEQPPVVWDSQMKKLMHNRVGLESAILS